MNRSNSITSFVGIEGSSRPQKPHLWEQRGETTNTTTTTAHHQLFLNNPNSIHCPPPFFQPPMNTTTLPLYALASLPDYRDKREDGLGLNLGHRTYFSSGVDGMSVDQMLGWSNGPYSLNDHDYYHHHHNHNPPRCQVEGCKTDISGAKQYHRRHKVCAFHSKADFAIVRGMHQRFCQQCSRFHGLGEFDEAKRSCRKRLADHNRRRRKSQPQVQASTSPLEGSSAPNKSTTTSTENSNHTPITAEANASMNGAQRNDPTLSLGGAGALQEEESMGIRWTQRPYQYQRGGPFFVVSDEMNIQQQQQVFYPASSFRHHNLLLCSAANEASQSTGAGSCDLQQGSLQNLGQSMFEVDFM